MSKRLILPGDGFEPVRFQVPDNLAVALDRYFGFQRLPSGRAAPPMMGGSGFSQYAETHILDHAHGKTSWTMPATPFLALCTVVPTSASTGTSITEANYTGYARLSVPGSSWAAAVAATPSTAQTNTTLTFAACTGGSSTIIGWALCDASTVGNVIEWGTCASTVISSTQTPATIASGSLSDTLA